MNVSIDNGNLVITLTKEEISGVNISAGSSYNDASVYAKINDNTYFRSSVEWEGKADVPEFVVALMGLVKQNKEVSSISGAWVGKEDDYKECLNVKKDKQGD